MPAPGRATFLLPARVRLAGQGMPEAIAIALGRCDRTDLEGGERAQLLRHFELLPRGWPVAALTRALDAGDAAPGAWLRADPAYVQPDLSGARLLACGDALQLDAAEAEALLQPLRPLFGDTGFPIDAPRPARWYLRLPREAKLPSMASPDEALGADLFDHLPEGSEGRRWRALLSEAQVVLHQHPVNAQRIARGKPPVNSLWFWGGGTLPDRVTTSHAFVASDEVTLRALAQAANCAATDLPARFQGDAKAASALYDLRPQRDLHAMSDAWLAPALAALRAGTLAQLDLDCEDGTRWSLRNTQRWRFWRKPIAAMDA